MPRIAILPDTLASQVAAGEVVERPSSVLKELIENCLDAGATQIEVEIRKGGIALMKVSDNGHGMDKENALLSLERHATSKLKDSEGLSAITTHGFRGEALPSIASVSRFKLTTNEDQSTPAVEISLSGGKVISVNEAGRAQGTTIEIKDLFFNVPARRKFLKSEATEYAHIEHALRVSALGNNTVRYIFTNNGKTIWNLKPSIDKRLRIAELVGNSISEDLIEVPPHSFNQISLSGFILPGKSSRGSSRTQTTFINNRPVDDPVIKSAIRDGYHGHIHQGQFPVVWLWIEMPPSEIDVNVHPAKKEVRFTRPTEIKHAISEAIASALSPKARAPISPPRFIETPISSPPLSKSLDKSNNEPENASTPHTDETLPEKESFRLSEQWSTPDQTELSLKEKFAPAKETEKEQPFTFLGQLKKRYWLLQDENGLVVLDLKAAKQRITYETLKTSYKDEELVSQPLLIPVLLELDGHDQSVLNAHLEIFNELGVEISHFGGNSYQVLSLPSILDITEVDNAKSFILEVIDNLEGSSRRQSQHTKEKAIESLLISLSEKVSSMNSHSTLVHNTFLNDLMKCDIPYCTPKGKPTMIHYSESELKKKFS